MTSDRLDNGPARASGPDVGSYEKLKEAIMSGELRPGQALVESALAEWCQVSRTPVREALTRLSQDGLVERGQRGLVVKESTQEEILDLYETRIYLESAAARMAAERRNPHNVSQLRRLVERDRSRTDATPAVRASLNAEFHRAVWAATHNSSMIDLLERLQMHVGRFAATTLGAPGRWEIALHEHGELLDAIEAADAAKAGEAASRHFAASRDIRVALWENDHDSGLGAGAVAG